MITKHWAGIIRESIKSGRASAASYGQQNGGYNPFGYWGFGISSKELGIRLNTSFEAYEKALAVRLANLSEAEQEELHESARYWNLSSEERRVVKLEKKVANLQKQVDSLLPA